MDPKLLKLFASYIKSAPAAKMDPSEYTQKAAILRASLAPIIARIREKMVAGDKKGPEMDRLLRSGGAIIGMLHQYDKNVDIQYSELV